MRNLYFFLELFIYIRVFQNILRFTLKNLRNILKTICYIKKKKIQKKVFFIYSLFVKKLILFNYFKKWKLFSFLNMKIKQFLKKINWIENVILNKQKLKRIPSIIILIWTNIEAISIFKSFYLIKNNFLKREKINYFFFLDGMFSKNIKVASWNDVVSNKSRKLLKIEVKNPSKLTKISKIFDLHF